jgi:hypothetical protein
VGISRCHTFGEGVDGPNLVPLGREFRMELELFHRPYYINFLGAGQKGECEKWAVGKITV